MRTVYLSLPLLMASGAMHAELMPATFEDLGLAPESHWCGDTEDPDYDLGSFRSGSFEFSNFYYADWGTWAYFAYANYTGNHFSSYVTDQWNNAVGGGHDSAAYGVVYADTYMGYTDVTLPDHPDGATVSGMWVVNSAWVADCIANGDGMSGPFGAGDTLRLHIVGFDKDDNTTETDFLLADYTSENPEEWYAVNDWRWMSLSELGSVVRMRFNVYSSKANEWGQTTPAYVCIDDLGGDGFNDVEGVTADSFRVSVSGGTAFVAGADSDFTVTPFAADGRAGVPAKAVGGVAEVVLPGSGVNMLRVVTPAGSVTLKVIG
ncbi:MAG: DUF4465 domain-containing protein [Muribaculaceae bacterium]|nr:DUF4465 domain-containing protein [Muribaculaceae bacterium]